MNIRLLAALVIFTVAGASPALKEYRKGNLQFTANTYKELVKVNDGKNILVCPVSVQIVLALAEAGAQGKTSQELIEGLNLPNTEEKIHDTFKSLASELNVDKHYILSTANKIYVKQGFKIRSKFQNVSTEVFNAEVNEIDFTKSEAASKEINNWVSDRTHGKITDLTSPSDFDEDTRLALINALYFQGNWTRPFSARYTMEKTFKSSSTENNKVDMMEILDHFGYFEDKKLNAKFLKMDYANSKISMIFVLPNDVDGLHALESDIEQVLNTHDFVQEEVHVQIPKVHVETKIEFIPIFKKMGINTPFTDKADFSKLNENEERLQIALILQKTFIDIEESGTTAAAATEVLFIVGMSAPLFPPPPPKEFEANHPFIFILRSETSGILFVGRYLGPGK